MASKQQIQFTDENYFTIDEARTLLGAVATESIWPEILSYRSKNRYLIDVSNFSNDPYYLTLTPAIKGKLEMTENKIKRLYGLLTMSQKQTNAYEKITLLPSLIAISTLEKSDMQELSIKALFNRTYNENDESHYPVIAYRKAALHFSSFPLKTPDDVFLADAYERLLGHDVLTFYRYEDFDESFSHERYLYTRNTVFSYAPSHLIDPFTISLYDFAQNKSFSPLIRSLCSLFLINQFKPFMDHNASLAALFAKDVLGYDNDERKSFFVPLEPCLIPSRKMQVAIANSQKEGDLTYALLLMNELLNAELDKAIKSINETRINIYSSEYKPDEEEVQAIETLSLIPEETKVVEEVKQEEKPIEPKKTSSFFIPDWKAIEEEGKRKMVEEAAKKEAIKEPPVETKPEPLPIAEEKKEKPKVEPIIPPAPKKEIVEAPAPVSYSVSLPDNALSPSEIKEYAQYLIETNPRLSKKQAVFLANHCTVGRYYTVQDFKKSMKVVYETARTSMEKLANEGYYVKAQVKNKFVYTPRKKEE